MTLPDTKTIVITGATSGIGRAAAIEFARMRWRVIFVARNTGASEDLLRELRQVSPVPHHQAVIADLACMQEVRRAAQVIRGLASSIDVLANNVGAIFRERRVSIDGLEMTFALNHMSYFLLTLLLIGPLRASGRAHVICTTSRAHRRMQLDLDDLQSECEYRGYSLLFANAYGRSKLCNLLFARELTRRVYGTGISVSCFHPGIVRSRFSEGARGLYAWAIRLALPIVGVSPQVGANLLVDLVSEKWGRLASSGYFDQSGPATPSAAARDDRVAAQLWAVSSRLAGIDLLAQAGADGAD